MSCPRAALAALLALTALGALPAVVVAHSELASSTPADGEVIVGGPPQVVGDFTEPVDPGRSSMELRRPDGVRIATGGVPDGGPSTRMTIPALPQMAPGTYTVRWTTVTPDDDGVERGTFDFTVEAPTAAPPTPSPAPAAPTAEPATPSPTPAGTAAPTPAPSTSPEPDLAPAAGPGDVLVPLAVLAAVLAGGAAWLLRRRR